jgi:hypothetical protein
LTRTIGIVRTNEMLVDYSGMELAKRGALHVPVKILRHDRVPEVIIAATERQTLVHAGS